MDKAIVAYSVDLNPKKAGLEIATKIIKNNESVWPKFIIVISTIHYEKDNGFEKLLESIYSVISDETPLIGGTVSGFMTNEGCFTYGVGALALFSDNMEASISYSEGTKINPKLAAINCINKIKSSLEKSKNKNKLVINFISSGIIPEIPVIGKINNTNSKILGHLFASIGIKIAPFFGTGLGREEYVVDSMSNLLDDYYLAGCSCIDENKFLSNYQFFNKKVLKNSIVALGGTTPNEIFLKGNIPLKETGKKFTVTKTMSDGSIICEIENVSARKYFFEKILGFSPEQFGNFERFYYKTSHYFPLGFSENNDYTSGIGAILGDYIMLGYKVKGSSMRLLTLSGDDIIKSFLPILDGLPKKNSFALFFTSGILLNILGHKCFDMKKTIDSCLDEKPYLVAFSINENLGFPKHEKINRVYSTNVISW